jgi:hypothetical protein
MSDTALIGQLEMRASCPDCSPPLALWLRTAADRIRALTAERDEARELWGKYGIECNRLAEEVERLKEGCGPCMMANKIAVTAGNNLRAKVEAERDKLRGEVERLKGDMLAHCSPECALVASLTGELAEARAQKSLDAERAYANHVEQQADNSSLHCEVERLKAELAEAKQSYAMAAGMAAEYAASLQQVTVERDRAVAALRVAQEYIANNEAPQMAHTKRMTALGEVDKVLAALTPQDEGQQESEGNQQKGQTE